MACSLSNTKSLFRKKEILNKFDELTQDTGAKVTEFNQLAFKVKELAIAKYGPLPEGALKPIRLDGKKAIFNPIFFDWVDRKNAQPAELKAEVAVPTDFSSIFYQLTDTTKLEKNDVELDNFLLDFLTPFGVQAEELSDYKDRFGRDSLGVTDVLNKLIYFSGNRNVETVPEEFGHMLSFLMGPKHPVMKQLLDEIVNWEEYAQVYNDYYAKYDYNAGKVKLEAIGKLIAKRLVAKSKEVKAPKSKLEQLIDKLIEYVMNTLKGFYTSGYYSRQLADKIASEVLMGNRDFVYQGYKNHVEAVKKFEPVSFEKALKENKLASKIVQDYGYKFGNPLVGSIAIAGQGERILRSPNEPIHDLDFIVETEDKYLAMMAKLNKDQAQPVHYGWSNNNKSYTTYAFFIPLEGHTVEVLERTKSGWVAKDDNNNFKIRVRNSEGKVVPASPQNVIPVDFFVYPNDNPYNETIIEDSFSSWQDIFRGKLGLSSIGDREIMFQRDKDQVDYIMNNPVSRAVKPNPIFMFYQLDSNKNTIDPTAIPEDNKLEGMYLKMIKSLKNRLQELEAIRGRESRIEINSRIKVIKNSLKELESSISVARLFNVAFWDISAAKNILNKADDQTTPFDMNEVVRIISVLEGFDVAMADIITSPEEKKYVIAIRNAIAELTPQFNKKLAKVVEGIAKGQGYDYTYSQLTKAVEDLGKASSLLYSPEESHIPILRVAASVLNQFESDVADEKAAYMRKYEELQKKYKDFDFSQFLEDGRFIVPYKEEYYQQEAKVNKDVEDAKQEINELYKTAELEGKEPNKIKLQGLYQRRKALELIKFDWYKTNNTFYLTPEMEEEFNRDLQAKRDSLTDPITGEVDEEAYEKFKKEHSPFENAAGKLTSQVVEIEGRKMRVFNVTATFMPKGKWYRYLTYIPKTGGKIDWTNSKYDQIKDHELYKFIIETFTEGISRVPHDLYSETSGPHKILRKLMFDATSNTFSFNTWGKDALDTVKNWYSIELTSSDIEDKYKGVTDYAGREKTTIMAPKLQKIKGAQNPLELATRFFELASEYDNATKVVPITDLLQYQVSQMDAIRTNSITGEMYKVITNGAKTEPEVVKQGLTNALKSLTYKTNSVLSRKTALDQYNVEVTPEEKADLIAREKKWMEEGMVGPRPTIRKTSHVVIFDAITDFTRLNLIGLKPFTAAANVLVGMSSNYMYAARNKEFNDGHLWKATKIIFQSLFKVNAKSKVATPDAIKLTLLAEKFRIVTNLFEGQDRKGSTAISKAVNKLMYLMQERGEYSIHTQLMVAMMYGQKVTDVNGKEGNLWDAYVLEKDSEGNSFLAWNEKKFGPQEVWQNRQVLDASGLNISQLKKFEENLRKIRIATQGDYQNALLGKAQWYGRTAFLFRTWLPSAIRQRFGEEIEGEFKGRYRTWAQYAKKSYKQAGLTGFLGSSLKTTTALLTKTFLGGPLSILGIKELSKITDKNYEESLKSLGLSDLDVENMRANMRELQMVLFLVILAGAFKQLADDDDDPELTFSINLAQRLHQDLTFFINPDSAMAVVKDPIPIWKTLQDATDVWTAIWNKVENSEKDIYVRGRYKGQSKLSKELIDLFPGWSGIRSTIGVTQQQFNSQSYKYK
jgi:hypothetical protein